MFFPVCVKQTEAARFVATVPDLPGCTAEGDALDQAITRIHLKIEGAITDKLIAGESLPPVSRLKSIQQQSAYADCDCFEIHINIVHLTAVARHQQQHAAGAAK